MELKQYQHTVLNDLKDYLEKLDETSDISKAFSEFWKERVDTTSLFIQKEISSYKNNVAGVPNVCVKVPTAGGKTFIA
jgi:type III restriction enzyme